MKKIFFLLIMFYLLSCSIEAQIPVPEKGCYHAAFTGNDTHNQFVALAKKDIAVEMFFTGWPSNKIPDFPLTKCNDIVSHGSIPHITWMIYTSGTTYPLDAVINGSYDGYINGYADEVKNWGKPLFIRLGHEFNGDWYPYGGANNGGSTKTGFGDPDKADGPERFIAAYKHVVDLFRAEGATNVTWIWCPNNGSSPNEAWNAPENYYPGDDYVDWIGLDGYNFGLSQTWSAWVDFWNVYNSIYQKFQNYNKPMMIAEFASVELGGNKSEWIRQAYTVNLKYSFPKIKAVTWFHTRKNEGVVDTDWRINSSASSLSAYQNAIADPYYLSSIATDVKKNDPDLPIECKLEQNYPNPFNPSTEITYSIPKPGRISLKIYDLFGREVCTLLDEYQQPGTYRVQFSNSNPNLSSGVYLYTLRTPTFTTSKKMVLLK